MNHRYFNILINATNKLVTYFPDNKPDQDGSEASVGV